MPIKACWAYDFACDLPLESILASFNAAGPWLWRLRESSWYGDTLDARPFEGVRVRVHEYPSAGPGGAFTGLRESGFTALLRMDSESSGTKAEVDAAIKELLIRVGARGLTEIEPYD